jgi:hypothetical protein
MTRRPGPNYSAPVTLLPSQPNRKSPESEGPSFEGSSG